MKIYVASSWRNNLQPEVVTALRDAGNEVYDFKNPPNRTGFDWAEIHPNWQQWTAEQYKEALQHPIADAGFLSDFNAMDQADVCVLVLPCGRSAHTEAGYMAGEGKPVIVLTDDEQEPELMYKIYNHISTTVQDVLLQVNSLRLSAFKLPEPELVSSEGAILIGVERLEQLTKHQRNKDGQLSYGARLLSNTVIGPGIDTNPPKGWDVAIWQHMCSKPYAERLIIAGALLAAEYDRVTNKNQ